MTRFLNNLGDRVNPIVVKEMRQAVNSRFVAGMLVLFLGIELIVLTLMLVFNMDEKQTLDLRLGRQIFAATQGILLVSCMLLIPILTGGRLASERSDVNVDLLFISSLSPRAIMMGKCCAAAALAILIFSALRPFMTFAYLLRGLDIPTIVVVLTGDFLAVLLGTMFALFIASIPANIGIRILLGLFAIVCLGIMTVSFLSYTSIDLMLDIQADKQSGMFWLGFAGICGGIFGGIGLLFFWATALISPPASNRAFLVRLYAVALWLYLIASGAVWSLIEENEGPMSACGLFATLLFSLQMLIATSERDHLGHRVLHRIPRSPLLRLPAFLFTSGAAGGFLFAIVGCIATVAVMYLWRVLNPTITSRHSDEGVLMVCMLLPVYTYCYCMTAVILRRLLRSASFKFSLTWLLACIIFGLSCLLPFIAHAALFARYRSMYEPETMWVFLPSAPVMIGEAVSERDNYLEMTIPFLVLWVVAVTAINAPWLIGQVIRFKPPTKRADDADEDKDDGGVDYVIRKREARQSRRGRAKRDVELDDDA